MAELMARIGTEMEQLVRLRWLHVDAPTVDEKTQLPYRFRGTVTAPIGKTDMCFEVLLDGGYPSLPPVIDCTTSPDDILDLSVLGDEWSRTYSLEVVFSCIKNRYFPPEISFTDLEIAAAQHQSLYMQSGEHELQGSRPTMEDATIHLDKFEVRGGGANPGSFYAVLDGHGGTETSQFAAQRLPELMLEQLQGNGSIRRALHKSIMQVDKEFLSSGQSSRAGSTLVAVVHDGAGLLTCANVGDSRAVLCRNGKAVDLSTDQKPTRSDETARIIDAGGYVTGNRTLGQLAVARALGDKDLKEEIEGALIATPEIEQWALRKEDEFVLVACDGLYDVMTSQEAIDFVRDRLKRGAASYGASGLADICEQLTKEAVETRGSRDNVSVIVAIFTDTPSTDTPSSQPAATVRSSASSFTSASTAAPSKSSAAAGGGFEWKSSERNSTAPPSSSSSGESAERRDSKSGGDVTKMDDEELMDFMMDDSNFA
jgi:protein phosphatase 2C family protein 2/3